MNSRIPSHDLHTHSTFSDGSGTLLENVMAASRQGLNLLGFADHVRSDSAWIPAYVEAVDQLRSTTTMTLLCGVEAKLTDACGNLDAPAALDGIDFIAIADHMFPVHGAEGAVHPKRVKTQIEQNELTVERAITTLIDATIAAAHRHPRVLIAHLFSVLPKAGLDEHNVPRHLLHKLADGLSTANAVVEISERWRCPSEPVVRVLAEHGVHIVASTDSHRPETIGRYSYVTDVLQSVASRHVLETGVAAWV